MCGFSSVWSALSSFWPAHHYQNNDPVCGCQIGTKCPVLHAKQDQLHPISPAARAALFCGLKTPDLKATPTAVQGTYDKLLQEVPKYKMITPSVLADRLRVSACLLLDTGRAWGSSHY
jgi:S25 ribosomal protein